MATGKSLVLILSRELAANLATPMLLFDQHGTVVYFNEPAEQVIGQPFEETGEISATDWAAMLEFRDDDGRPLRRQETPAGIAFAEHRPAHRVFWATTKEGVSRRVAVTSYPLWSKVDEFAGAVVIFWEEHAGDAD